MHAGSSATQQLKVAVSGASGLIGSALCCQLSAGGQRILRLVRRPPRDPNEIEWDPARGVPDRTALEGLDAVVHLAGENITSGLWTRTRRQALYDSRVVGTRVICESLAALRRPPRVLLSASAIGYYGDRGDEILDEASPPGQGFLPELCVAWENAARAAAHAGLRVVLLRFGLVITPAGGIFGRALTPFRLGLGGPFGCGDQWISWVAIEDAVGAMELALQEDMLSGAVNVVSPHAVTNLEFTRALGRVLRRPTILRVPATLLRLALGSFAKEALLASTLCRPTVLHQAGYAFQLPRIAAALQWGLAQRAANR